MPILKNIDFKINNKYSKEDTTLMFNEKTDISIAEYKKNNGNNLNVSDYNNGNILDQLNHSKYVRLSKIQEEVMDAERNNTEC